MAHQQEGRPAEPDGASRSGVLARTRREHSPKREREQAVSRYPDGPGYKDEGPGREAAVAYSGKARTHRQQVLEALHQGPGTAEEIGERIGLHWYLTRPRLSELHALGQAMKTGERGRGALGGSVNRWRIATSEELALVAARRAAEAEHGEGADG